jgi:hypothetical protein
LGQNAQHLGNHRLTAVQMKFNGRFARKAGALIETDHQGLIEITPLPTQYPHGCSPRGWQWAT